MSINNDLRTYQEWLKAGYQVQRGEHSGKRNEKGEAVFSASQVREAYHDQEEWDELDYLYHPDYHDADP